MRIIDKKMNDILFLIPELILKLEPQHLRQLGLLLSYSTLVTGLTEFSIFVILSIFQKFAFMRAVMAGVCRNINWWS